jgi:nucleoid-associated protein YgaU
MESFVPPQAAMPPGALSGGLQKAQIKILAGSRRNDPPRTVLFNPTEYTFERSNTYKATAIPGLGAPLLQFVNGEADVLSMELFLDESCGSPAAPGSARSSAVKSQTTVGEQIEALASLLDIDRDLHAPPPVEFHWGRLTFKAVIEKLGRKVTLFRPDGVPLRATLSVSFKQYRTLQDDHSAPRRESSDKSKRRVMTAADSLWALAAREYGDPARWRLIAETNDLDDPRDAQPGVWVRVPPLEETDGPSPQSSL